MGCLFLIFAVITPRIVMFFIFLFSNWFSQAFNTFSLAFSLSFHFHAYTTLAYTVSMVYNNHQVSGGWLIVLIIAVIVNIGGHSGSYSRLR